MFEGNEIDISFSKKKKGYLRRQYEDIFLRSSNSTILFYLQSQWNHLKRRNTSTQSRERANKEKKKVVTAEIETLFCATIWYQSFCSHDKYKIKNKRGGSQIVWFLPFILLLPFHHLHEFLYFQLENYWFHHLSLGGKYCHTIFQRNMALEKKK